MKKKYIFLIAAAICVLVAGYMLLQKHNDIHINYEKSFFSDFHVEEAKVYIECVLCIENNTAKQHKVKFIAESEEDKENGLIMDSKLNGYNEDLETSLFDIESGENRITVIFVGNYGGVEQKVNRLLPRIYMEICN